MYIVSTLLQMVALDTEIDVCLLHLITLLLCVPICRNKNLGDGIDYAQQQYDCLGELISDTLALFEQRGGEDAFINIKYMVGVWLHLLDA